MIRYENHCCGCAVPAYPCIGDSCQYMNVPVYYCDFCDDDIYAKYDIDGEHYCEDCAKNYLKESLIKLCCQSLSRRGGIQLQIP